MASQHQNNITHIGGRTNNAAHYSVEQLLELALEAVRNGEFKGRKAVVVFLDDDNDKYDVKMRNAGLSCSQIVALAEVLKVTALGLMGYPN